MEIIDMLLYGNGFTNLFFGCAGAMFIEMYKEYKEGETEIEKLTKLIENRDKMARLAAGLQHSVDHKS